MQAVPANESVRLTNATTGSRRRPKTLWQGRVELVIEACRLLVKKAKWAQQSLTYYSNNIERMRYDQFRASDFLIGSSVMESGCKQIVTQRLKLLAHSGIWMALF